MTKKVHVFVITKNESVLKSWARDASTAALIAGVSLGGIVLDSGPLVAFGLLLAFIVMLGWGNRKNTHLSASEAKAKIEEIEASE